MAVKGQKAKQDITKKILETFKGSFTHEKEIRIPYVEDGVDGQIKVVLTAAKVMVENGEDAAVPGDKPSPITDNEPAPAAPSAEEQERLQMLLNKLGF